MAGQPIHNGERGKRTDTQGAHENGSHARVQHCQRPFQVLQRKHHVPQVEVELPCSTKRPELAGQPRQPWKQRTLRKHGTRARGSELVKICGEVVRAAGVHGMSGTDPRRKSIDADETLVRAAAGSPHQLHCCGGATYPCDVRSKRQPTVPAAHSSAESPSRILPRKKGGCTHCRTKDLNCEWTMCAPLWEKR